jgi:hypothetical protein
VIGAGAAGIAAALALASRTERVTLVDRADVPGPEWEARPRPDGVRAVLASPQVVVRAGLEVVGFVLATDDGPDRPDRPDRPSDDGLDGIDRISGVLVRSRRARAGAPAEIAADLVVDARGPVAVLASLSTWSDRTTRRGRDHVRPRPVEMSDADGWAARGAS